MARYQFLVMLRPQYGAHLKIIGRTIMIHSSINNVADLVHKAVFPFTCPSPSRIVSSNLLCPVYQTEREENYLKSFLHTWDLLSTLLTIEPVETFQKQICLSAVPPPVASNVGCQGHQDIACM